MSAGDHVDQLYPHVLTCGIFYKGNKTKNIQKIYSLGGSWHGVGFTSDYLRKWLGFFELTTKKKANANHHLHPATCPSEENFLLMSVGCGSGPLQGGAS